jgi:hypothetical protein
MKFIALFPLVLILVACSSTATTHHVVVARTTVPPNPGPSASALTSSAPLTCGTKVGTSQAGTPLTVTQMIANLDAVFRTDTTALDQGIVSDNASNVLIGAAMGIGGYSGNKLSNDAAQFSQDEAAYNPGPDPSEVNTSAATAMLGDILTLTADCPKAYKISQGLAGG